MSLHKAPPEGGYENATSSSSGGKAAATCGEFSQCKANSDFSGETTFPTQSTDVGQPNTPQKPEVFEGRASEHFADAGVEHSNKTAFENLLCIEIFSGSGRLTATIRKLGVRSVAIDRSATRTSGPVTTLDLTKAEDLQFLKDFIASERYNLLYVHL